MRCPRTVQLPPEVAARFEPALVRQVDAERLAQAFAAALAGLLKELRYALSRLTHNSAELRRIKRAAASAARGTHTRKRRCPPPWTYMQKPYSAALEADPRRADPSTERSWR